MSEFKLAKEVLEDVYGRAALSEIWAVNYPDLIPFTLQSFEVGSVLPAAMYMFRRGHRRIPRHESLSWFEVRLRASPMWLRRSTIR